MQTTQFFLSLFAPGTSANSAPVETKWRFLEMALKNICFPDVSFNHIFSSRNQVFRHTSTRRIIRKPYVLQGVSMIFTLVHSNEGRKKHSNCEPQILKRSICKPYKSSSCWDKTIGCERTYFLNKNQTFHKLSIFWMTLMLPKHCFLQWIRTILTLQNSAFLGPFSLQFAASWAQNTVFYNEFQWF